jgi:predicted nucleic acid-binding protein
MIVVDTNLISYLLIPGAPTVMAQAAASRAPWSAPLLWRSEFRNVLAVYMRHKGLTTSDAQALMAIAERLLWGREFTVRSSTVLDCVARSQRSAYDCEFVALALDLGIPLVTTDEALIADFPQTAIHLREFVKGG